MAFLPGLKKQINKANQFMSEKISGVEGTKLDNDFYTMERKTDLYVDLVDDLQIKTKEYLQPNPTVRAKMAAVKGISKLSGQAKASTYPQPEGTLGDAMTTFGNKLLDFDNSSVFANALSDTGESLKQMADLKYALDDNVKQNFLEPLHHLQSKDLKEVAHHRKKLQGRKLDYDCKKRKQQSGGGVPEKEIKQAEDKFAESLHLAQMGMHNIMENDVEQISQLAQFAEALLEYHRQCSDILQSLTDTLYTRTSEASGRSRKEFTPKTLEDLGVETSASDYNIAAPNTERALRNSGSSRLARPASAHPDSAYNNNNNNSEFSSSSSRSNSTSSYRPSSQPNFQSGSMGPPSVPAADLDPWDAAETTAAASAPPPRVPTTSGWTVFPAESSPVPPAKQAWAQQAPFPAFPGPRPPLAQKPNYNNNSSSSYNGFSNLPAISPGGSPAGTPSHHVPSGHSSGFGDYSNPSSARHTPATSPSRQPSAQALYDFEPENPGELGFKEGEIIHLKQKVDDNWFEGTVNGKTGFFPINYVTVLVNLP